MFGLPAPQAARRAVLLSRQDPALATVGAGGGGSGGGGVSVSQTRRAEDERGGAVLLRHRAGHLVFVNLVSLPGERAADPISRSGLGFLKSRCCVAVFSR